MAVKQGDHERQPEEECTGKYNEGVKFHEAGEKVVRPGEEQEEWHRQGPVDEGDPDKIFGVEFGGCHWVGGLCGS